MPGFADNIGDLSAVRAISQPIVTIVTLLQNTSKQIVLGDPYRTTLIISNDGVGTLYLGNDSGITGSGIVLTGGSPWIVLTQHEHGLIVTLPWWGFTAQAGGMKVGYIAQSIQSMSGKGGTPTMIQEVDDGTYGQSAERRKKRPRRTKLYGDRWAKHQAPSPYDLPLR